MGVGFQMSQSTGLPVGNDAVISANLKRVTPSQIGRIARIFEISNRELVDGLPAGETASSSLQTEDRGYFVSNQSDKLFITSDRGATFQAVDLGVSAGGSLKQCARSGDALYVVGSDPKLVKTSADGGSVVDLSANVPNASMNYIAVSVDNSDEDFIAITGQLWNGAGFDYAIYVSTDGGLTFVEILQGSLAPTVSVRSLIRDGVLIVGNGDIFRSTDRGSSFSVTPVPIRSITNLMWAGDQIIGYGFNSVFRSTDLGQSWEDVTPTDGSSEWLIAGMSFDVLSGDLYMATRDFGSTTSRIIRSSDNGRTWHASVVMQNTLIDAIYSIDDQTAAIASREDGFTNPKIEKLRLQSEHEITLGKIYRPSSEPVISERFGDLVADEFTHLSTAYAPNHLIYLPPWRAPNNDQGTPGRVAKIDTLRKTIEFKDYGLDLGTWHSTIGGRWGSACVTDDGMIVCAPWSAPDFLVINPFNDTAERVDFGLPLGPYDGEPTKAHSYGIVNGGNGKLYTIPYGLGRPPLVIDWQNKTAEVASYSAITTGFELWNSGQLALNGKIYCSPYNRTTDVLVIDTSDGSATLTDFGLDIAGSGPSYRFGRPSIGPNGKILMPPYNGNKGLVIDPETETAVVTDWGLDIAGRPSTFRWFQSALGADGKIYCFPSFDPEFLVVDLVNNSAEFSTLGIDPSEEPWSSVGTFMSNGVTAADGSLWGAGFRTGNNIARFSLSINRASDPEFVRLVNSKYMG